MNSPTNYYQKIREILGFYSDNNSLVKDRFYVVFSMNSLWIGILWKPMGGPERKDQEVNIKDLPNSE